MKATTDPTDGWEDLADRERLFVTAYLGQARFNATKAAQAAGYAHPDRLGTRIRHRPRVARYIDAELKRRAMSAEEIVETLSAIARRPGRDWFKATSGGMLRVDLSQALEAGLLDFADGFDYSKHGDLIVKMPDRMAALTLLARVTGLLKSEGDATGAQGLALLRDLLKGAGEDPDAAPSFGPLPKATDGNGA
jgi:hypothetical protein